MKHLLLLPLLSVIILQGNSPLGYNKKNAGRSEKLSFVDHRNEATGLSLQPEPGTEKRLASEFKKQEYCYAELKDFEWDVHYSIVSATVYFSGTNFRGAEFGTINGPSLKPLNGLMSRCAPGSIVIFDNVKVKGPDNLVRPINGLTILLH